MIYSNNTDKYRDGFEELLKDLDASFKNADKPQTVTSWKDLAGKKFETEVYERLKIVSRNTVFDGKFEVVSGQKFPDIVAFLNKNCGFGIEAKTTLKDHWKSTGSSIVESTRIEGIDRIYLSFAKLGGDPSFMTKLYEDCLSGVAVTHSPRYLIDMQLQHSDTIFNKIGVSYENIRNSDKPFEPFRDYYTQGKKSSKVLWWASESEEEVSPPVFRLWSELNSAEKNHIRDISFLQFPEVLENGGQEKYQRLTLWLAAKCAVVVSSLRDLFTAGGRKEDDIFHTNDLMPAVIYKLAVFLKSLDEEQLKIESYELDDFDLTEWIKAMDKALATYSCEELNSKCRKKIRNLALQSMS